MVPVKNKLFSDGLISMKFNLPVIKADHSRLPPVIQSFRYVMPPVGQWLASGLQLQLSFVPTRLLARKV